MSHQSTPAVRPLHTSREHGLLECPDCETTIVGNYADLVLHYLDEHSDGGDAEAEATLADIKRAQQEARLAG